MLKDKWHGSEYNCTREEITLVTREVNITECTRERISYNSIYT